MTHSYTPSPRSTVLLLILWSCTIIPAGHGILPLGLAAPLLAGEGSSKWLAVTVVAVVALVVVVVVAASVLRLRGLLAIGEALLLAAWASGMRMSEAWTITLVTALPYLYVAFQHARQLLDGEVVEVSEGRS